jgi:hypothetical protein
MGKMTALVQHNETHGLHMPAWEAADLHAISKVAKHNLTACKLLAASIAQGGELQYTGTWECKLHWHFPTLMLRRSLS